MNEYNGRRVNVQRGLKGFQETTKHEARLASTLGHMAADREAELISFREDTEKDLALDAKTVADGEKTMAILEARTIVAEEGIQRVTYDIHEWDNNHLTNNPIIITDEDGSEKPIEGKLDGKLAGMLDSVYSQRGLEVTFAESQGQPIHLDMNDAPASNVITRERHATARELDEARRRADYLESEIVNADRAILSNRLNQAGLPGANIKVYYDNLANKFVVLRASTIDDDWPDDDLDSDREMSGDEYEAVQKRIEKIANETYSQTTLRAICKGRGGEFADSVTRSDFGNWESAAF